MIDQALASVDTLMYQSLVSFLFNPILSTRFKDALTIKPLRKGKKVAHLRLSMRQWAQVCNRQSTSMLATVNNQILLQTDQIRQDPKQ